MTGGCWFFLSCFSEEGRLFRRRYFNFDEEGEESPVKVGSFFGCVFAFSAFFFFFFCSLALRSFALRQPLGLLTNIKYSNTLLLVPTFEKILYKISICIYNIVRYVILSSNGGERQKKTGKNSRNRRISLHRISSDPGKAVDRSVSLYHVLYYTGLG